MAKKITLWERLEAEGFFSEQKQALPWVMAGNVFVGQTRMKSLMARVEENLPIVIKGFDMPYVAKGGLKLEGAIRDFGINVKDRICIDAGACTGGFTDCFIKHGAARVYAVEVGFGQLAGSLRQNKSVVNLEKTNISDEALLKLSPVPDLGSVDLSYLSLRKGVPAFKAVMRGKGELLCLVKPLFETEDAEARRTGEIDAASYLKVLAALIADLNAQENTRVLQVTHSGVTGNHGTHEFFVHVAFGGDEAPPELKSEIDLAVQRALSLHKFKK